MKNSLYILFFCLGVMPLIAQKSNDSSLPANLDCISTTMTLPYGDVAEDRWRLDCIFNINNEVFVFNRWGEPVFNEKNYKGTWRGEDKNGKRLAEGLYMYRVVIKTRGGEDIILTGNLNILH